MVKEESKPGILRSEPVLGVDGNLYSILHRGNIEVSSLEERLLYCLFVCFLFCIVFFS